MRLLFASTNKGKCKEMQEIAARFPGLEIVFPDEVGDDVPVVEETGRDYSANARLKVEAFREWSALPTFADDSGLEVNALAGQPGVHTARYARPGATAKENMEKLLGALKEVKEREARFRCVLIASLDEDELLTAEGVLEGRILYAPGLGAGGFGYDPLFAPVGFEDSLADLKAKKIAVKTHRVLAAEKLFAEILAREVVE
jgi:XTP/dITP diphosphohydrolase